MTQTVFRILAWSSIAVLFVVTDLGMAFRPHTIFTPAIDRFTTLVCIGGVFSLAYPKLRFPVLALLLAAIVSFELLQRLIAGRHGFVKDMYVKGTGACVGVFSIYVLQRLLQMFHGKAKLDCPRT